MGLAGAVSRLCEEMAFCGQRRHGFPSDQILALAIKMSLLIGWAHLHYDGAIRRYTRTRNNAPLSSVSDWSRAGTPPSQNRYYFSHCA